MELARHAPDSSLFFLFTPLTIKADFKNILYNIYCFGFVLLKIAKGNGRYESGLQIRCLALNGKHLGDTDHNSGYMLPLLLFCCSLFYICFTDSRFFVAQVCEHSVI